MASEPRLRWTDEEWASVMGEALPLIQSGLHKVEALWKAQRKVLHKTRHRDRDQLAKTCTPSNGGFDRALVAFKALPAAERAALSPAAPEPSPAPSPKPEPEPGGLVRWTSREWAIMAAGVNLLRQEEGHGDMKLHDLYIKAQRMILPADRQRSAEGIKQAGYAKGGLLRRQHDEAIQSGWKFPETKNPYRLPPANLPETDAPVEAAASPPQMTPTQELAKLGADPMQAAVILFGQSMMSALESLLKTRDGQMALQVTQTVVEQAARVSAEQTAALSERIGQTVQELLQVQIGHIAAEVSKGLRTVLLEELGGPATKPATPSEPEVLPEPPQVAQNGATGRAGLRIDVIGTIPVEWRQRIKDATGAGDEVRFVDFGSARDFAPHRGRHLIVMAQGKMPRVLQKKCEAAGVQPISVRDAAGHVLRAVQDLKGSGGSPTLQ